MKSEWQEIIAEFISDNFVWIVLGIPLLTVVVALVVMD